MSEALDPRSEERVETPKQLAKRVGLSERQIRHLIQTRQIEHVFVGSRVHIPIGAFPRFLDAKMVRPAWQDETRVPSCATSTSAPASISPGPKTAAAVSAQLV